MKASTLIEAGRFVWARQNWTWYAPSPVRSEAPMGMKFGHGHGHTGACAAALGLLGRVQLWGFVLAAIQHKLLAINNNSSIYFIKFCRRFGQKVL